jgi:hypothetical protein
LKNILTNVSLSLKNYKISEEESLDLAIDSLSISETSNIKKEDIIKLGIPE